MASPQLALQRFELALKPRDVVIEFVGGEEHLLVRSGHVSEQLFERHAARRALHLPVKRGAFARQRVQRGHGLPDPARIRGERTLQPEALIVDGFEARALRRRERRLRRAQLGVGRRERLGERVGPREGLAQLSVLQRDPVSALLEFLYRLKLALKARLKRLERAALGGDLFLKRLQAGRRRLPHQRSGPDHRAEQGEAKEASGRATRMTYRRSHRA